MELPVFWRQQASRSGDGFMMMGSAPDPGMVNKHVLAQPRAQQHLAEQTVLIPISELTMHVDGSVPGVPGSSPAFVQTAPTAKKHRATDHCLLPTDRAQAAVVCRAAAPSAAKLTQSRPPQTINPVKKDDVRSTD